MGLLDLLYPKFCFGCQILGEYFCSNCAKKIPKPRDQVCPICNKISITGKTHDFCNDNNSLDGVISLFVYKSFFGEAIKTLKYKFAYDLSKQISQIAIKELKENKKPFQKLFEKTNKSTVFIPIPLSKKRANWRGFNQAELAGEEISKAFFWQFYPKAILRNDKDKPQAMVKTEEREENIKNTFVLNEEFKKEIKNKKIILFDDVYTTGATLKEAAKVLRQAKPRSIWGLALAK